MTQLLVNLVAVVLALVGTVVAGVLIFAVVHVWWTFHEWLTRY